MKTNQFEAADQVLADIMNSLTERIAACIMAEGKINWCEEHKHYEIQINKITELRIKLMDRYLANLPAYEDED